MVPKGLRFFFVVHFVADIAFAIPLFVAPVFTLGMLGWTEIDPVSTRLVAAALFGIGIESLLGRNATAESFRTMLNLKVIWSLTAVIGLAWSIAEGAPVFTWALLAVFVAFHVLWLTYRLKIGNPEAQAARA